MAASSQSMEFFLKNFIKFSEFCDKTLVIAVKGFKPVACCVRDQDATRVEGRYM